jgi:hypothetical protein
MGGQASAKKAKIPLNKTPNKRHAALNNYRNLVRTVLGYSQQEVDGIYQQPG